MSITGSEQQAIIDRLKMNTYAQNRCDKNRIIDVCSSTIVRTGSGSEHTEWTCSNQQSRFIQNQSFADMRYTNIPTCSSVGWNEVLNLLQSAENNPIVRIIFVVNMLGYDCISKNKSWIYKCAHTKKIERRNPLQRINGGIKMLS